MIFKSFFSELLFLLLLILSGFAIAAIYTSTWVTVWTTHLLWIGVTLISLAIVFVLTIRLIYANNWLGVPIVLKPVHNQGIPVGLIFIQGEGIPRSGTFPLPKQFNLLLLT